MSYNVQYKHTDRSAIDRRIAGLQAELDELTPNEDGVVSYPCPDTAKLNEKIADLQAQLDDITPTEGEVYSCTDTAILNAKLDNIQEQIDDIEPEPDPDDPTPDPEPTGDTTNYEEYCIGNLGGEWNPETNMCTFEYNGMPYMYGTDTIDLKIACDSTPGSTWDYTNVSCCDQECACTEQGGTWDPTNNECVYPEPDPDPEPDPCEGYADPMECNCVNMGGSWIEDPENPGTYICDYPEL